MTAQCLSTNFSFQIVLPFWDWTAIHKEECMLYNPYQIEANLTEEDCEVSKAPPIKVIRCQLSHSGVASSTSDHGVTRSS